MRTNESCPTPSEGRRCRPCEGGIAPLTPEEIAARLPTVNGWEYAEGALRRTFRFSNYEQTLAFVNAVARIAIREDHHPRIEFGYRDCAVRYWTHAAGGVTENDFICAEAINALPLES